jgi:hypothetical protein
VKKQVMQVSPEDFDVQMLLQAAREGRLYVEEEEKTVSREYIINNVRAYVQRISPLATRRYREVIDTLWEEIFQSDVLIELLMPKPKARKCKDFDKYGVMRLIGVLREKDVYERYSDRKYMALLEQSQHDCSYRSYLGMGLEERSMLVKIRQIVAQFEL